MVDINRMPQADAGGASTCRDLTVSGVLTSSSGTIPAGLTMDQVSLYSAGRVITTASVDASELVLEAPGRLRFIGRGCSRGVFSFSGLNVEPAAVVPVLRLHLHLDTFLLEGVSTNVGMSY